MWWICLTRCRAARERERRVAQGIGDLPPGNDSLPVYVSAFVDRLLEVSAAAAAVWSQDVRAMPRPTSNICCHTAGNKLMSAILRR